MGKTEKSVIAGLAGIVLFLIVWTGWDNHRDKIVISSEPAGIAQTAQFHPSAIRGADTTQITTDKGTFLVIGTFQLIKGAELVFEKRASGNRYLCDHKSGFCNRLN